MEHYGQHIFVIFSAYSKRDKICLKNEKKYNCKLVSCNSGMIVLHHKVFYVAFLKKISFLQ